MRNLYLAWRYSGGRLCPYRMKHNLDEDFRPHEGQWTEEWKLAGRITVPPAPRPPSSFRRLRNVLIAFALLAEEEAMQTAGMALGGMR